MNAVFLWHHKCKLSLLMEVRQIVFPTKTSSILNFLPFPVHPVIFCCGKGVVKINLMVLAFILSLLQIGKWEF